MAALQWCFCFFFWGGLHLFYYVQTEGFKLNIVSKRYISCDEQNQPREKKVQEAKDVYDHGGSNPAQTQTEWGDSINSYCNIFSQRQRPYSTAY